MKQVILIAIPVDASNGKPDMERLQHDVEVALLEQQSVFGKAKMVLTDRIALN